MIGEASETQIKDLACQLLTVLIDKRLSTLPEGSQVPTTNLVKRETRIQDGIVVLATRKLAAEVPSKMLVGRQDSLH